MAEPNFIISGAVASGTSFLSHSIKDHPQIYLPKIMRPECGFFYKSWEYKKGLDYYRRRWFSDAMDEIAVGERSSLYLHGVFNNVAQRIRNSYPDIKLIFCLRNPTERAFANYRFTTLTGFENLSFSEAIKREEERTRNAKGWKSELRIYSNVDRGKYYEQLLPFYEAFGKDQILCIKSETMSKNPSETLRDVFQFLGVDDNFEPPEQASFTAPNVKSPRVQKLFKLIAGSKLDLITEGCRQQNSGGLLQKIVELNLTPKKQQMRESDRIFLNEYYAPHNRKLESLLGWDVTDWV